MRSSIEPLERTALFPAPTPFANPQAFSGAEDAFQRRCGGPDARTQAGTV